MTQNDIELIRKADNLMNNYPFEVILHYMGGWKIGSTSLEREIFIGVKGNDEFIPATFKVFLDKNQEILSYGGFHSNIHIGKEIQYH